MNIDLLLKEKIRCENQGVRGLCVVSGKQYWCDTTVLQLLMVWMQHNCVAHASWVSSTLSKNVLKSHLIRHIANRQSLQMLGGDCENLIVNLHNDLDLNLLGRVVNTLKEQR